ncbi:MAG: MFS transporter [Halieaceae bacterium]|nr:MFS transporter [Halieaceae bacterium]
MSDQGVDSDLSSVSEASGSDLYKLVVVSLLMIAYLLSFLDRQILVLMIEPMQRDLQINDTLFSLLHGTAFALFYTIFGLVAGRLVDSHNRRNIIVYSIALWSLATALCGIAKSFVQLFIARMLVGVGEAGLSPGTFSIVSDLYEPKRRGVALSIYGMGIYLGTGCAFIFGGHLIGVLETLPEMTLPLFGQLRSWQLAFVIVGLPGVALALIIYFVVREPSRGVYDQPLLSAIEPQEDGASFKEFVKYYRSHLPSYLSHNLGFGLHMMFAYAVTAWVPVFFMRHYDWSASQAGLALGSLLLTVGPIAILSGGFISQQMLARGTRDAHLLCGALSTAGLLVGGLGVVNSPSSEAALVFAAVCVFFMAFPSGINAASLQTITPARFRGQASAFYMLVGNLLGLGLGPLLVAMFSDYYFGGPQYIGSSLELVALITMPVATWLLLWRRHDFAIDVAA